MSTEAERYNRWTLDKLNNPNITPTKGQFLKKAGQDVDPKKADALLEVIISHIKTRLEGLPGAKEAALSDARGLAKLPKSNLETLYKTLKKQALETARAMPGGENVTARGLGKFIKQSGVNIPTYSAYRLLKDIPSEGKTLRRSLSELLATAPEFFEQNGLFDALLKGDLKGPDLAKTLKAFDAKTSGFHDNKAWHHTSLSSLRKVLQDVSAPWRKRFQYLANAEGYKIGDTGLIGIDPIAHKMFDPIKDGKFKDHWNPKGILAQLGMGPVHPKTGGIQLEVINKLAELSSHGPWARGTVGFDILGDLSKLTPEEAFKAARPMLDIENAIAAQGKEINNILQSFQKSVKGGVATDADYKRLLRKLNVLTTPRKVTDPVTKVTRLVSKHQQLTEGVQNLLKEHETLSKAALTGPQLNPAARLTNIGQDVLDRYLPPKTVDKAKHLLRDSVELGKDIVGRTPKGVARRVLGAIPVAGFTIDVTQAGAATYTAVQNPTADNLLRAGGSYLELADQTPLMVGPAVNSVIKRITEEGYDPTKGPEGLLTHAIKGSMLTSTPADKSLGSFLAERERDRIGSGGVVKYEKKKKNEDDETEYGYAPSLRLGGV